MADMGQLTWYRIERQTSNDRIKGLKCRLRQVLLVFLFVYTLCYLLLMNGIYITNLTHKTSININVHQSNMQSHIVHDYHNKGIGDMAGTPHGRTANKGNRRRERQEPEERTKRETLKTAMFFYKYKVLNRIPNKYVFYLSAIRDPVLGELTNKSASTMVESISVDDIDKILDVEIDDGIDAVYKTRNIEHDWEDESGRHNKGVIVINGWESHTHVKLRYLCCYKYYNNVTKETKMIKKITWNVNNLKIVKATQFVCPLLLHPVNNTMLLPISVGLMSTSGESKKSKTKNKTITKPNYSLVETPFPRLDNVTIGLCAKIIYKNFSTDRLIEWIEFNRLMGVTKIMLFTYNISSETKRILDYYMNDGIIHIKEFDYPIKKALPRLPGGKNVMAFQDEQVTVFDCMERFKHYDYVAVLDLDEFLVPSAHNNWRDMLADFRQEFPEASGFSFHTQVFTIDWGISNPDGKFYVTKYVQRTRTMWDRKKNIIMPSRVLRGSVWTHEFTSLNGYQGTKVTSDKANIFHYRKCRPHWIKSGTCLTRRQRHHDETMLDIMERIQDVIIDRKTQLLS